MNKKLIEELTGLGSNSLVVIGRSGLKRIICPFKVMCREPIHLHFTGDVLLVRQVKLSKDLKLIYKIEEKFFLYSFFEVLDS
jgi:hypothetical protein